ncbi:MULTISPECIES: hypothetical protein [Shewanella]|uniref:hypothetical protein n=1 Tax=Shewanella TaxID=22 RepID=UPI0011824427|nr:MULTISPECIES: hypothetical protein [Shewanella]MBC8798433.1 hypothetical protein [Shewanella algae]MBO2625708.1 hypothetical protein [Shewanella algae]MCA0951241.1 hypothetical protein [Shewanella chilikensis]MCE9850564.1 hypothetical protein [Shewanella chilikensis]MCL1161999.1 hypothetical protein [Shewanella chilikensis]
MKTKIFIFLLFFNLAGCVSTESGRVFTMSDNVHPEEVHSISLQKEKVFKFKIANLSREEVEDRILIELRNNLSKSFSSKSIPVVEKTDTFESTIKMLSKNSKIRLNSELNWNVSKVGLAMSFKTIQSYESRKAIAYQDYIFKFKFNYSEDNDLLTLKVEYPDEYRQRSGNMGSMPIIVPPFSTEQLQQQIEDSFNDINITRIGYFKEKIIKGSFIADYQDDSVYANFIQLRVNNTTEHKIEKTATIHLSKGDMHYVTNVSVYPYRDIKSKVVYESYLKSVHWLNSDGTTDFDDFPSQNDIQKMLKDIVNS